MKELPNIERANEHNVLWPSIADAVDTFLRRRENADAFERIWRLIHIWESVVTTLSGAAACRLRQGGEETAALRLKVREHLFGVGFDKIDKRLKQSQGALDGSNDRRIDILRVIHKENSVPGEFLTRLKGFLGWPGDCETESQTEKQNQLLIRKSLSALLDVWNRVCDIPGDAESAANPTVVFLISVVNVFRNRYAHVPFPYDPIRSLADALEQLTDCLFAIEPRPSSFNSVLSGGLVSGETLWRGCSILRWKNGSHNEHSFVFPANKPLEDWPAGPFVLIDANKRPYVLTRLKDREAGIWEYTRFKAEANSVVSNDSEEMLGWIAPPSESDYLQEEDLLVESETPNAVTQSPESEPGLESTPPVNTGTEAPKRVIGSFGEAIEAVRQNDYDAAIPFLQMLVRKRPNYHIGWLRLGYAQREQAARLPYEQKEVALTQLNDAFESFTHALGHIDPEYRASAFYERSKALYRKYAIGGDRKDAEAAVDDAQKACALSLDTQIHTWVDYLQRLIRQTIVGHDDKLTVS